MYVIGVLTLVGKVKNYFGNRVKARLHHSGLDDYGIIASIDYTGKQVLDENGSRFFLYIDHNSIT